MEPDKPAELNYFNYFTEVEEHFQKARGTSLFLLSPLDWALIETWKNADIPLEAVLRGIDLAFEKWRSKKVRGRQVNSLTYCAQAVTDEAERMAGNTPVTKSTAQAPFTVDEVRAFLAEAREKITLESIRTELTAILDDLPAQYANLEALEQRLTAMEDKMIATARAQQTEADLTEARRQLDSQLRLYRGKMSTPQLVMLEKQFLDRWLLERLNLPRLSLFYLH